MLGMTEHALAFCREPIHRRVDRCAIHLPDLLLAAIVSTDSHAMQRRVASLAAQAATISGNHCRMPRPR